MKWTKNLSELAAKIGEEAFTVDNDGNPINKDETLVRQIWDEALGYETVEDDPKTGKRRMVKHKPQRWAKELLWARREGAVPAAAAESGGGMTAAKQVRELSTKRLNKVAEKAQSGK